ncbi:MAG TPA: fibronectin type III domain-containing protein [Solirubrobacteraceae bacterium]|nr:fibronectin type III domain-containing protein [Solirubrobacteraceae bacterium]
MFVFVASAQAAPPESPSTYFPAAVGSTTAILHGVLDETVETFPVEPGTWEFLYKAASTASAEECESAGASKAPVPPGAYFGAEPESVFQEVTGLSPNTEYVVCLAAENGSGERTVGNAVAFETAPETPETGAANEVTTTSARLEGVLKPAGTPLEYEFRYSRGTACAGGAATPSVQGEGAVSAVVEGLTPGTEYTFCLVALNNGGEAVGEGVTFMTPLGPPALDEEYTANVGARSAALHAAINPDGLPTTYRFEWGPTTAYGCGGQPCPEGGAGAGKTDVGVEAVIEGLSPGTTYHFRIVAANTFGGGSTTIGTDRTFTTQAEAAPRLIDGRGWELVSPPDKRGAALEAAALEGGAIQASQDGGKLAYIARAPIDTDPAGNRSFAEQQLLASREAGSWTTQDIATPHEAVAGVNAGELSEYRLFSPNLSIGLVEPTGATPLSPAASERTPYRREANGEYVPLVTPANVPPGTEFGGSEEGGVLIPATGVRFATASPDLAHVLLSAPQALTEGFETGGNQALYEWFAGKLQPISVLPGQVSAAGEGGADTYRGSGGPLPRNVVSANGDRVFFRTATKGHLFVRDASRQETVQLDGVEEGAEGTPGETGRFPLFQGASTEGTLALFTDDVPLTVGSSATPGRPDLYACNAGASTDERSCAEKGSLHDLTAPANSGEAANVLGTVLGYSEDGQYVYFVANGVLTNGGTAVTGATHGNCLDANEGRPEEVLAAQSCDLYVWHDGVTSLVARLSGADFPDWEAGPFHTDLGKLTARVSPDGRFLAFMSQRPLTGYDNRDAVSRAQDEEVFLYDANSGRVVCASCDPTGARPTGVLDPTEAEGPAVLVDRPRVWKEHWLAGSIPGWTPVETGTALYQPRYLSNEGRVFFNSPAALVPAANQMQNVYEFEPEGIGDCTSSTSSASATFVGEVAGSAVGGCVGLISSGTSGEESAFLDAAAAGPGGHEGEDVFFLTASRLAGADVDDALDVYDAHVCSSLLPCPSPAPAASGPCASAGSCRPASGPSSAFGAPPSTMAPGTGNLAPPPPVKPAAKPPTRAQKLAKALKACRRKHDRRKRVACEREARRKYGAAKAGKAHKKPKKKAAKR